MRGKQAVGEQAKSIATTRREAVGGAAVQEFQTLYQENLSLIYRYVYSKVGNREEAEDLTSQIFVKAVLGVDHERGIQSKQKWLFQVSLTIIAHYFRAYY